MMFLARIKSDVEVEAMVQLNYMVDLDWMMNEVRNAASIPILVIHGLRDRSKGMLEVS